MSGGKENTRRRRNSLDHHERVTKTFDNLKVRHDPMDEDERPQNFPDRYDQELPFGQKIEKTNENEEELARNRFRR